MKFASSSLLSALPALALVAATFCLAGCDRHGAAANHAAENKNIVKLTKASFQADVLSSSQPVLVDFWAEWCGPCKVIAPIVSELATEFEGKAKFGKVDVDAEPSLASEYGITAIPTLLIFQDGKKVDAVVGVQSKAELKMRLNKFVTATIAPVSPKP